MNGRRIVWALHHQVHTAALDLEPGQVLGHAALVVINGGVDANLAAAVQDLADAFRLYQSRITEPSVVAVAVKGIAAYDEAADFEFAELHLRHDPGPDIPGPCNPR